MKLMAGCIGTILILFSITLIYGNSRIVKSEEVEFMNSEHCSLCLSQNGLELNGKRLSLLEWIFDYDLNDRKFSGEWNDKSDRKFNCAICFDCTNQMGAFSKHIDIWFSEDGRFFSDNDFEKIDAFYKEKKIAYNIKYKLNLDFEYDDAVSRINGIKTEADFVVYNCIRCYTKMTGLSRFHLYYTCPDWKKLDRYLKKTKYEELKFAIIDKKVDEVKALIDSGADVNSIHPSMLFSPLDTAVAVDSFEICEMLIKAGADVNFKNGLGPELSMMQLARRNKNTKIGKLLLTNGLVEYLDDYLGNSNFSKENFSFLLECGINPNKGRKEIPLIKASIRQNVRQVQMLLKHGASPNIHNKDGLFALRIAIYLNNPKLASYLIQYGAEVNYVYESMTNLKVALTCEKSSLEMIKVLILGGARIDAGYDLDLNIFPYKYVSRVNKFVNGMLLNCFLNDELNVFVDMIKFCVI